MAYIFQSIFALEFKSFLVIVRDAGQQTRDMRRHLSPLTPFSRKFPDRRRRWQRKPWADGWILCPASHSQKTGG